MIVKTLFIFAASKTSFFPFEKTKTKIQKEAAQESQGMINAAIFVKNNRIFVFRKKEKKRKEKIKNRLNR